MNKFVVSFFQCRYSILLFWVTCCLALAGCAASPFDKESPTRQIKLTITLAASPDISTYDYIMVFSGSNSLTVSEDVSGYYFLSPGVDYDETLLVNQLGLTQQSYYQSYFSTWSDYITISSVFSNTPALFNGPFLSSTTTETQHMTFSRSSNFSLTNQSSGNTIQLLFPVNNLSVSSPTTIYFRFFTVARNGGQGNIQDIMAANDSISVVEGEVKSSLSSSIHTSAPAAARIQSWRVEIF